MTMMMIQRRSYTKFKTFINPDSTLLKDYIVSKVTNQPSATISPHLRYNVFSKFDEVKDNTTAAAEVAGGISRFHEHATQKNKVYRSMLVVSTPNQIKTTVSQTYELAQQFPHLQIVTVCIDSVLRFRNGISIGLFHDPMVIKNFSELKDQEEDNEIGEFSFDIPSSDEGPNARFKIGLANTIFEYGKLNVLYFFNFYHDLPQVEVDTKIGDQLNTKRSTTDSANGLMLRNLHVEFPTVVARPKLTFDSPLRLLTFEGFQRVKDEEDVLRITEFKGNLIKSINNKPASKYLESNELLLNSKDCEVFLGILDPDHIEGDIPRICKVTTGGGGWGEKGSYLAIDTKYRSLEPDGGVSPYSPFQDLKLSKDMRIQFYLSANSSRSTHHRFEDLEDMTGDGENKLILEVCEPQDTYVEQRGPLYKELLIEVDNVLALAPEGDVQVGTTRYACRGARVTTTLAVPK